MTKFNQVIVWMARNTVISGIERSNGEAIEVCFWSFDRVQEFAYEMAELGVSVQAIAPNGTYWASYLTGDETDGKLYRKGRGMAHTYSIFRDHAYFEKDGYYMYRGVPVRQETMDDIVWYTFRNIGDYEHAARQSCCSIF